MSDQSYKPPPHQLAIWSLLGGALIVALTLFSVRGSLHPHSAPDYPSRALQSEPTAELLPTPPPDDEYYPCSDCHEDEPTNRTVRILEDDHDDFELGHGDLWCLHCHDVEQRDLLRLADAGTVELDRSWELCIQCHSQKRADWRAGVHGKRTGFWWGRKEYRTCVVCHDPHSPAFKALEPERPPKRPEEIRLVDTSAREPGDAE